MSRPGYVDKRGSTADRARRRAWLLETFDPDLGPGRARCALKLSRSCVVEVDEATLSVDRKEPGGSYRRDNIQPACKPCQDRQGYDLGASAIVEPLLAEYRAQRDARDALRESGALAPSSVPGTAGADVAMYQLSDEEFDEHVPRVTFREWLIASREQREQGELAW